MDLYEIFNTEINKVNKVTVTNLTRRFSNQVAPENQL